MTSEDLNPDPPVPAVSSAVDGRRFRASRDTLGAMVTCGLLLAVIFALDLVSSLNLSILYLVPLLLAARLPSRKVLWGLAGLLIVLTYVGYFFGPHRSVAIVVGYRPVNRAFVMLAIMATALRFDRWLASQRKPQPHAGSSETEDSIVYDLLLCGGLAVCTFLVDLLTPRQYNLPILYIVPLTICATLRRPTLLWGMLACLLVFTVVGFLIGPPSTVPQSLFRNVVQNRIIAVMVQVCIVLLAQRQLFCTHVWTTVGGQRPGSREWVCSLCRRRIVLSEGESPVGI